MRSPGCTGSGGAVLGDEDQGDAVDAVAGIGRGVVPLSDEDVPKVGVTGCAPYFRTRHAERLVFDEAYVVALAGLPERGPPAVAVELLGGPEELGATCPTAVAADGLRLHVL